MNLRKIKKEPVDWYSVRAAANSEPAEIFIYDEIGGGFWSDGVTPKGLIDEVKALKLKKSDTLNVRINSPGGDVFDGNTIYNYLRSLKSKVAVTIDGLAASAASVIAMAGDTISMPENSFLMILNPWMFAMGDSQVMRKAAGDLDEIRGGVIKTYLSKVGDNLSRDELVTMLDEETWLSADKAVELGFADEIMEPVRAAALAKFHLSDYFEHVPDVMNKVQDDELAKRRQQRERFNQVSL
jgi:ATP-dependent Clp protease protease subunit